MSRQYLIRRLEQMELLTSPMRQEIVDAVCAKGTVSVRDLALELGAAPDNLYYHLKKLLAAGLVVSVGKRKATRRHEEVFRTPGDSMRVVYDLRDARFSDAVRRAVAAALRMARRDFDRGFCEGLGITRGRHRNLWGARLTGWLSRDESAEVNVHLARIEEIFASSRVGRRRTLHALTWVLTPLKPKQRAKPPQ